MNNEHKPSIIITGANGNIGSAMAACWAEKGYHLILLYHLSTQRIDKIIKQHESSVIAVQADITNLAALESSINKAVKDFPILPKALIHTASMRSIDSAPLVETTPQLWQKIIETNILGTYNILKATIPFLIRKESSSKIDNWSRIVLFGSDVSRIGLPKGSAYAASKAAVANLTRSLAYELAEHNILINTLSPGPVDIDDTQFSPDYQSFRSRYYEKMLERTPLRRIAQASDLISFCHFLISPENRYITGEEFFITGGKL